MLEKKTGDDDYFDCEVGNRGKVWKERDFNFCDRLLPFLKSRIHACIARVCTYKYKLE